MQPVDLQTLAIPLWKDLNKFNFIKTCSTFKIGFLAQSDLIFIMLLTRSMTFILEENLGKIDCDGFVESFWYSQKIVQILFKYSLLALKINWIIPTSTSNVPGIAKYKKKILVKEINTNRKGV